MIQEAIIKLSKKQDLTEAELQKALEEIMRSEATPVQMAAFLTALAMKNVTPLELITGAKVMRKFSLPVKIKNKVVLDTCGTGGDSMGTFNISTICAIIVAASGICVAKHGNRSISSKCGSADLCEALGIKIGLTSLQVEKCIEKVGIGFMFAPLFHPAMKYVQPVRKELGIRTIFNFLGPLVNPAQAQYHLLGVSSRELLGDFSLALKALGVLHALVVRGLDGLDEMTTTDKTEVYELKNGNIKKYVICAWDFGIKKAKIKDLLGEGKDVNAKIALEILDGKKGPKRDIVCFNAAAALYIANRVSSLKEGLILAQELVDSGAAREKLRLWKDVSNKL